MRNHGFDAVRKAEDLLRSETLCFPLRATCSVPLLNVAAFLYNTRELVAKLHSLASIDALDLTDSAL